MINDEAPAPNPSIIIPSTSATNNIDLLHMVMSHMAIAAADPDAFDHRNPLTPAHYEQDEMGIYGKTPTGFVHLSGLVISHNEDISGILTSIDGGKPDLIASINIPLQDNIPLIGSSPELALNTFNSLYSLASPGLIHMLEQFGDGNSELALARIIRSIINEECPIDLALAQLDIDDPHLVFANSHDEVMIALADNQGNPKLSLSEEAIPSALNDLPKIAFCNLGKSGTAFNIAHGILIPLKEDEADTPPPSGDQANAMITFIAHELRQNASPPSRMN